MDAIAAAVGPTLDAAAAAARPTLDAAAAAVRPALHAAAAAIRPALSALPPPATVYVNASRMAALPGWAVLAAAVVVGATPRPRGVAAHLVLPVIAGLAATYVVCMVAAQMVDALPPTDLSTLDELRTAFGSSDWLLTAGWVHYLCFDLLVGLGVMLDAGRRRAGRGGVAWRVGLLVCLALILALGPAGALLYGLFRTVVGREPEEGGGAPAAAAAGNVKED